jgi:hypothetical protein
MEGESRHQQSDRRCWECGKRFAFQPCSICGGKSDLKDDCFYCRGRGFSFDCPDQKAHLLARFASSRVRKQPCWRCGGKGWSTTFEKNINIYDRYFGGRPVVEGAERCPVCGGRG